MTYVMIPYPTHSWMLTCAFSYLPALFACVRPTRQENVSSLDLSKFLRLNGARKIGIGTSFALPVVSKWGVTFVIVFYTRDKIQVKSWLVGSPFSSICGVVLVFRGSRVMIQVGLPLR